MIDRVSDSSKGPKWMDNEQSIKRDSISKSAMDSFSTILVKRAKQLKASGQSYSQIAATMKLSENVLKGMIEAAQLAESQAQFPCGCAETDTTEQDNQAKHMTEAEAAYEEMYGKKKSADLEVKDVQARSHIVSAKAGVADLGGPRKQMKTQTNPTIFDPNKLDRIVPDNGERIRAENAAIEKHREEMRYASRNETIKGEDIKEALKSTIQGKDVSVSSAAGTGAHKYSTKLPMNGMSIFDDKEFARVEETQGEKMVQAQKEEAAAKKEDKSWLDNGRKTVSSKDFLERMIESMQLDKE
jgi:hypothetical protein